MGFFSEYRQINQFLSKKRPVVFYAESRHYYVYFEKLLHDLAVTGTEIWYITSDAKDPLLKKPVAGVKTIYVKWLLGFLFARLKADVMIMTMPGLGNYLFKRSANTGTYIYVFHAAVSLHQQYEKNAFFHYDAVFCTGDYQTDEARKMEELYAQPPKNLVPYGYPLLNDLKPKAPQLLSPTILVAPSWFSGCIFDCCIEELLQQLAPLPYRILLRSHPEYEKRKRKEFEAIKKLAARYSNISIDTSASVLDSLVVSDLLVTDRSGIAIEFAIGMGRPVLFVDTVLKETNKDWSAVGMEPLENSIREDLGLSVAVNELPSIPVVIKALESWKPGFAAKMEKLKKEFFYNSPASYEAGVEFILGKLGKS